VTVGAGYAVLLGSALVQLCHTVENRSDRFYARCDSPVQYVPLVGGPTTSVTSVTLVLMARLYGRPRRHDKLRSLQ
jgi:hypothetical protein